MTGESGETFVFFESILCCYSFLCKSLFQDDPSTRDVFGLKETDVFAEEWENNSHFVEHARRIVDMIDCAVNFLGPDFEAMEEILLDLGSRHVAYGAQPRDFAIMGNAFILALGIILKSAFTDNLRNDWNRVFGFMTEKLAQGMVQKQ